MTFAGILEKTGDGAPLTREEIVALLCLPPSAHETYRVLAEASRVSRMLPRNRAEVHAQFAPNLAPCPETCAFCSFPAASGIFSDSWTISPEAAQAVTRLATPWSVVGNCTHEPCTPGAMAGANLFWAESGANPRDTKENTEEGRGRDVAWCASLFRETEWEVLQGPPAFYT